MNILLVSDSVSEHDEKKEGILDIATYKKFQVSAELLKNNLVSFLLDQKKYQFLEVGLLQHYQIEWK